MVALLAMVGLIIDGGNAFAQQRVTQNGADASSEAGAVVLMQKLVGVPSQDDAAVNAAVQGVASTNQLATPVLACYTDLDGTPLDATGSPVADCTGAAQVGGGVIPPCDACPGKSAAGVRVYGSRSFGTFVAGVVGINTLSSSATATAIAGYVDAFPGSVIPVTFPLFATGCDGSGNAEPVVPQEDWPTTSTHPLAIPLCKNGPGNVGWIDWVPPAGGAGELADAIRNSTNPPITTPKWYHIAGTGSVSGSQVQSAMEFWYNKTIVLPIFNATCAMNPNDTPLNWSETNPIGAITDCVDGGGSLDAGGPSGTNQWYFLVGFAAFHLDLAFINGGDSGACASFDSLYPWAVPAGNIDSCLIGYFEGPDYAVSQGTSVGAGGGASGSNSLPAVQLIR
jgi:hypothetical protein